MKSSRRPLRNILPPVVILIPLIGLMMGCIYIPTFDHTLLTGTKSDFRDWAEKHKNITAGLPSGITRWNIEVMFGKPAFTSSNGRCVAYIMGTESDILIWPLCFGGGFDNGKTHVLKLVYNNAGQLQRVVPLVGSRSPPFYMFGSKVLYSEENADPMYCARHIIDDNNRECPVDETIDMNAGWLMHIKPSDPRAAP